MNYQRNNKFPLTNRVYHNHRNFLFSIVNYLFQFFLFYHRNFLFSIVNYLFQFFLFYHRNFLFLIVNYLFRFFLFYPRNFLFLIVNYLFQFVILSFLVLLKEEVDTPKSPSVFQKFSLGLSAKEGQKLWHFLPIL
ncbi:hypothetical protein M153_586000377 [Pseudoloma neurophilia]|uniref:Transmembrane protein n=1 Tax=Pseudoloma neurophilia TaxID=146866 RepID=A0A0R0M2S6_9MICR|nr:hypothetical protein M153_586000377 [Pseudoloma neurophilia]